MTRLMLLPQSMKSRRHCRVCSSTCSLVAVNERLHASYLMPGFLNLILARLIFAIISIHTARSITQSFTSVFQFVFHMLVNGKEIQRLNYGRTTNTFHFVNA